MRKHFRAAFHGTMEAEGVSKSNPCGYSNHGADRGGETVFGIARNFHPNWPGWQIVDAAKKRPGFPGNISHTELWPLVEEFYAEHFWKEWGGDVIPSSTICEEMFDTAVNAHPRRAVRFLQEALNLLNMNEQKWKDLEIDGRFGPNTFKAVEACLSGWRGERYLYRYLNMLQGEHYIEIMRKRPSQEVFARGWTERVDFRERGRGR